MPIELTLTLIWKGAEEGYETQQDNSNQRKPSSDLEGEESKRVDFPLVQKVLNWK
jgi:hypothetical protein